MKTQWQKEIEKLHQSELAKLSAITDLEKLDITIREQEIRIIRTVAFAVVAAVALVLIFI